MAGQQCRCNACGGTVQIPASGAFTVDPSLWDELTQNDIDRAQGKVAQAEARAPSWGDSSKENEGGLWRDKDCLVVAKRARFPNRCLRTNRPTTNRVTGTLHYYPGWLLWTFLLGGWPTYFLIGMAFRKTITVEIPVTKEALYKYHLHLGIAIGLTCLGVALGGLSFVIGGDMSPSNPNIAYAGAALLAGAAITLAGLIYLLFAAPFLSLQPKWCDQQGIHMWIKGVHPRFLTDLPHWDGYSPF